MDEKAFSLFRASLLAIIAVLLVLLAVVGVIAVFVVNPPSATEGTTSGSSLNIYKMERTQQPSTQEIVTLRTGEGYGIAGTTGQAVQNQQYTKPVTPSQGITRYPQQTTETTRLPQNLNVQTTVHVHPSSYAYYPRTYSRQTSPYRTYRYNSPYPYGFRQKYGKSSYGNYGGYNSYGSYGRNTIQRGTYSYNW